MSPASNGSPTPGGQPGFAGYPGSSGGSQKAAAQGQGQFPVAASSNGDLTTPFAVQSGDAGGSLI